MLRGLSEGIVGLRDQRLSPLVVEDQARLVRARLNAHLWVRSWTKLRGPVRLQLFVRLLPHRDLLREFGGSISFIHKSGLLFEDLQGLLLPEVLLLVIVHLKSLLAFVELMQLVCDGDPGASQGHAYLPIPGHFRLARDWMELCGTRSRRGRLNERR